MGKRGNVAVRGLIVGAAACALLIPGVSTAQKKETQKKETKKKDETAAPKVTVRRGKGGRKVYRIETGFVIEGRIQKPNAFYFLERAQINYNWLKLKKDFLPRILKALKGDPF